MTMKTMGSSSRFQAFPRFATRPGRWRLASLLGGVALGIGATVWATETPMGAPITARLSLKLISAVPPPGAVPVDEIELMFRGKRIVIPLKHASQDQRMARPQPGKPRRIMEGMVRLNSLDRHIALAEGAQFETVKRASFGMTASSSPAASSESQFVSMIALEGKCFHVDVAPDGATVKFQEVKTELGELDTKCPGLECELRSDECSAVLSANADGKWQVPVGQYTLHRFQISRKEGGAIWTQRGEFGGSSQPIQINADTPATKEIGTPFQVKYSVRRVPPDVLSVGYSLVGKGGEYYLPGTLKNGKKEPLPKFTMFSGKGARLTEGQFEYG